MDVWRAASSADLLDGHEAVRLVENEVEWSVQKMVDKMVERTAGLKARKQVAL